MGIFLARLLTQSSRTPSRTAGGNRADAGDFGDSSKTEFEEFCLRLVLIACAFRLLRLVHTRFDTRIVYSVLLYSTSWWLLFLSFFFPLCPCLSRFPDPCSTSKSTVGRDEAFLLRTGSRIPVFILHCSLSLTSDFHHRHDYLA